MLYKQTTHLPNFIFDSFLSELTEAELKVLLVIARQTVGWIIQGTNDRKQRDRITHYQFCKKTGLSKRAITNAIQKLLFRKLITITDYKHKTLFFPKDRKGKSYLYYSLSQPMHIPTAISVE